MVTEIESEARSVQTTKSLYALAKPVLHTPASLLTSWPAVTLLGQSGASLGRQKVAKNSKWRPVQN